MTTKKRKRSGYDFEDWARDNPGKKLSWFADNLDKFFDPKKPGDASTICRVLYMDGSNIHEHVEPKTVSKKMAQINGRAPEEEQPAVKPSDTFELSDLGNAERLIAKYGDDFRYTHSLGWFAWNGFRWVRDDGDLLIRRRCIDVVRGIHDEAVNTAEDKEKFKSLKKFAVKSEAASKINAIPTIAQTMLSATLDVFDQHPMLINFRNGTLDLKTNEFREHRRGDYITQATAVDYDAAATSDVWEKFVRQILPTDELHDYVQDAIGYSLTGSVREQCMFICFGTGSNGKSTFTDTIINAFGDYGKAVPSKLMASGASEQHPTLLTELQWRRFASAQETKENGRLDESMIKQLSGGDIITAHKMRKDYYDFAPTHKLWLSTNHKPTIRGTDHGIWRRMRMIPFTVSIPDELKDRELANKLKQDYQAVLNWSVIGAMRWAVRGLISPSVVQQATDEYQAEQDTIGQWIEDCVVENKASRISKKVVYDSYCGWCDENGYKHPMVQRKLADRLTERGYKSVRTARTRMWEGISLIRGADEEEISDYDKNEAMPF